MPDPCCGGFYAEIKSWQSAIGSGFGFLALLAGALLNAHLNRRRDNRLRGEEAQSVAAALYGEIMLLREELARLAKTVAGLEARRSLKVDEQFLEAFELPEPLLYKAIASKIGLLDAELVIAITQFYSNFQQVKAWLPLLVERPDREYSYPTSFVLQP
jgi:hypothetical protein